MSDDRIAVLERVRFDRQRLVLWLVALALIALLAFVAWQFVGTLVLGLFVYYAMRPLHRRVHDHVGSRTGAAALTVVLVALPALVFFSWITVLAIRELLKLLRSEAIADYLTDVQAYVDVATIFDDVDALLGGLVDGSIAPGELQFGGLATGALETLGAALTFLGTAGLHAFIVLVIAFYLLRDDYRVAAWSRETFVEPDGVLDRFFDRVDYNLEKIFFGNILNALVTGTIGAVVYNLLNLVAPGAVAIPVPTLLGVLTGIGSLVPVVGMKIVWIPVAVLLFATSLFVDPGTVWFPALFALVSVVLVDTIPDLVLRPFVSGRGIHIGAVMLAYILGPLLFGWYGIFLGPLLLVVVIEFGRIVFPWLVEPTANLDAGADVDTDPDTAAAPPDTESDSEPPVEDDSAAADAADDSSEPAGE